MFSLVLPAYNEEKSLHGNYIENLISTIEKKYQNYEIIIVNDGSEDQTKKLLNKKKTKFPNLVVINHPINMGYGSSLKTGIYNAKFDTIVICDLDETYPYQNMSDLLEIYLESKKEDCTQFDMVIAQRTGKNYWEGIIKTILRYILRFMVEFSTGKKIYDINSGFRVFSKKTITKYFDYLSNHFSFTTSSTLIYLLNNRSIAYHKINYLKRKGNQNISKVKLLRDSLRTLQYICESLIFFNPLKFFFIISLIFFVLFLFFLNLYLIFNFSIIKTISLILFSFSLLSFLTSFVSVIFKKKIN